MKQKLLLDYQRAKLIENHMKKGDHAPVVKLFFPWGASKWLLSELNPVDNVAFGLCDLGMGEPEMGYVSLDELMSIKGMGGLGIERDTSFKGDKPLTEYANKAREERRIVERWKDEKNNRDEAEIFLIESLQP